VFDDRTPEAIERMAEALGSWEYPLPLPTNDPRCIGFILEQSIALHLRDALPDYESLLGGSTEYPNLILTGHGESYAIEVKAAPRTAQLSNRVKSPESTLRFYPRFKGHWVIALFYTFQDDGVHLKGISACLLELWRYSSTTFKDMSAICALGSLDDMTRGRSSNRAFRSEEEFLEFSSYMSEHPGTTAQRNAAVREWLARRDS
jgi:hypothetical protein